MGGSLNRQRTAFEKALFASLKPRLKGTSWKSSGGSVFSRVGENFVVVDPSVHRNAEQTVARLAIKPLAVDPILWDILDLPENHRLPLSYRSHGAYTCSALPVHDEEIERPGDEPAVVAERLAGFCFDRAPSLLARQHWRSFAKHVRAHPNQRERGAYAITLVCALIAEGNFPEARDLASGYASGALQSCHDFTSGARSFHDSALEWLAARERLH